jgi:hypothetical protein
MDSSGESRAKELNLTPLRVIINHVDRITWQARLEEKDTLIAVKCYADSDTHDQEVTCYQKLQSLQGISILHLVEADCEVSEAQGRTHPLLLSWIGGRMEGIT